MKRQRRAIPDWVLDAIGGLANTGGVVALGEVRGSGRDSASPWPAVLGALGANWPDVAAPTFCIVRPPYVAFGLDEGTEQGGTRLAQHICKALDTAGASAVFGVGATGRGGPLAEHAGRRALRALDAARKRHPSIVAWSQLQKK